MTYIQRRDNKTRQLETVDEFETRKEARAMLAYLLMSERSKKMTKTTNATETSAYELAWAEEGDGIEDQVAACGCGGACRSCRESIDRVERRARTLIAGYGAAC